MDPDISVIVGEFLTSYTWQYERVSENLLVARFAVESSKAELSLLIGLDRNWIGLTVMPLIQAIPNRVDTLAKQIGRINYDLKWVRLAQTSTGDVVLCLDLPSKQLTAPAFHLALDVITYYAEKLHGDLSLLAGVTKGEQS